MINGRVERCADNIMRRIVPVRDPRGPRLALSRPCGPKEVSPSHGESCLYLDIPGSVAFGTER